MISLLDDDSYMLNKKTGSKLKWLGRVIRSADS
jgi:hypothetical protein